MMVAVVYLSSKLGQVTGKGLFDVILLIAGFTAIAMCMNFFGFNSMRLLVFAGIVQGFSTPPLMLLIMLMTNDRRIMGDRVNGRAINVLGGITIVAMFAASTGLVVSWLV